MTAERPYGEPKSLEQAIVELKAGTQWDLKVVKLLLGVLRSSE